MSIYDLDNTELKSLLQSYVSPATENAIINALKLQPYYQPSHGDPIVETVTAPANVFVPRNVQLVLDVGGSGTLTVNDHGHTVIASGDGNVNIDDKGRGGDTIIGGAGTNYLQVTKGNNVLEAGSGHESIYAGSGHDTIFGGSGQDTIYGGGHDTINLGTGNTEVFGGKGHGDTDSVYAGLTGNDTIIGGTATTVYSAQSQSSIVSDKVHHGVTVITFSDKQVLHVQGATIDFKGGGSQNT